MSKSTKNTLELLKARIDNMVPDKNYLHDTFVIITLQEAIEAALEGNFGVGAVLVNGKKIVQRGHNRVFYPYFRSDMHAEMDVMTKFEEKHRDVERMGGYTLFSSIEPCPMCLGRLITSGVGKVYYAAIDQDGGMANRLAYMPPEWRELAERQDYRLADCSPELSEIALKVFMETVEKNDSKLRQR
ncbi:MAG: nucleoside deaminase [Dehalococcoidia bacterium]